VATVAFPWRPLGSVLVERGLLDEAHLEKALAVQRREGGKLGEILVQRGWVTPFGLAAALASQHGLELSRGDGAGSGASGAVAAETPTEGWKPLGRLLVEQGVIKDVYLKQALAEQHRTGARLGEILVSRGWASASAIASAVAAQHGLHLDADTAAQARLSQEPPDGVTYVVREAVDGDWHDVHTSPSFLDATDVAFDTLEERDSRALVIVRVEGGEQEVVWRYLADEAARAGRDTMLDLFGYPVVNWNAAPWLADAGEADAAGG
jgi:hypothetical protein